MSKSARKINATTQRFTEIENIVDDVVVLSGNQACMVLEVDATNFSLQSAGEQESRIFSYASLLNSLSFSIQIVILSRKLDISSYISLLDVEAKKTPNQTLSAHIRMYRDFVSDLVRDNTVLDKKFYLVISFSFLEKGAKGVAEAKDKKAFVGDAKNILHSKASSIGQELLRIGLKSKILKQDELIKLYYEIYNSDAEGVNVAEGINTPFVKGAPKL